MKQLSFLQLVITTLLAMTVLYTTNAFAKVYMGKITLEVGDTYEVSAVPTSGYTASGSFSKNGTNFTITANGSYYCKIKANKVGTGALSYLGTVARSNSWTTETYDMYWDVVVEKSPEPDPDPNPNDKTEEEISEPTDDWCKSGNYSISWFSKTKTEFSISTNKELAGMAYLINNGYTEFEGCTIKLCADIDLSGKKWIQCKTFKGTFDGQGHIISGIYMGSEKEEQTEFGFWKRLEGANISSLTLAGSAIYTFAYKNYRGEYSAGGLVGKSFGNTKIEHCSINLDISASIDIYWEDDLFIGGVCGYRESKFYSSGNNLSIRYCSFNGQLSLTENKFTFYTDQDVNRLIIIAGITPYAEELCCCEVLSPSISLSSVSGAYKGRGIYGVGISSMTQYCRSIIEKIRLEKTWSTNYYVGGIGADALNCYSIIKKIEISAEGGTYYYGGIGGNNDGEVIACFSNNDVVIESNKSVLGKHDGSTSFSSEQMKTPAFLEELNMYSIIEADGPVWTQPAEGGYPYIAALYEPTGINTIYSVEAKPTTVFSLSGQRLAAPKKGVNIIGGKKVVVK